jgi:peroxiredoxin
VPVATGRSAPAAEAATLDGAPVDLALLAAAGPAVLFFYKGDCGASDAAAHVLPRLAAVPGLRVAAISQDPPFETELFDRAHRLSEGGVRLLVDPDPWPASDAFGVVSTPTFVLLAPGGRVEEVSEGWSRDAANALAARAAALAGAPAPVVSTPADGPAFRPG